jgi:GGDEF domain-containing protein
MKKALRVGDTLARVGGDEFIVIMVHLENTEDSTPVLEQILKPASDPITVGDAVMQVSASIGLSLPTKWLRSEPSHVSCRPGCVHR